MIKSNKVKDAVDEALKILGNEIVLGTPLGAGKANGFINEIYRRAKANAKIKLTILTALTLEKPKGSSELEKRFLGPFVKRLFGNYPDLDYELDRTTGKTPSNIEIIEFYFPPGKYLNNSKAQQNYLSTNYTHAARDVLSRGVNLVCQQVCSGEINGSQVYSLSCNPDITIDIAKEMRTKSDKVCVVGQINPDLPFMYGESIVGKEFFDILLDDEEQYFDVFAPPKMSVSDADYMIGVHASTLVKDDGEIQIGIGSLGDALVYSLCLRENQNKKYREVLGAFNISKDVFPIIEKDGSTSVFTKGLFAATEMFVDSFAELYKAKILKKKCYDNIILQRLLNEGQIKEKVSSDILKILNHEHAILKNLTEGDVQFLKEFGIFKPSIEIKDGVLILPNGKQIKAHIEDPEIHLALGDELRNGAVAHAGFFLGPRSFYQFLKDLPIKERKLIRMKKISQINQLYGHEEIDRLQRKNGRFINTCMIVSLNGAASSDALENLGQVSGVGGQYNFVAMAHELPDARSVLQLRSWRYNKKGKAISNIVFNYGNCTTPRHLRDVVVTEYGIADLRGKTDEEVAIELIKISDSRFQNELLTKAKKALKIRASYKLPDRFKSNFPASYSAVLKTLKQDGLFPAFPFGSDFTEEELKIGKVLKAIKSLNKKKILFTKFIWSAIWSGTCPPRFIPLLERMDLHKTKGLKQKLYQKLLIKGFVTYL
ncbi:MAG: acetyl-CoA hydrolase [Halobacteriovorax sp.]|nr:acetyl-CoA hydrolase [Halobacteriovorax sp.]|tara:strand:- start:34257 stop:36392 length:2136 start_codon:yes stop_codon:yes gene_type:complete